MCQPTQDGKVDDLSGAPRMLRPWVRAYRSVPKVRDPVFGVDVAFTAAGALALSCLRLSVDRALLAAGWPPGSKMTTDTGMNITSALHAAFLVAEVGACLLCGAVRYVPSARMDSAPRWWQDAATALIQLCTGFMIYDVIFMCVDMIALGHDWGFFETMVLGHHVVTSLYMTSCLAAGAGHMSAMILMFTGECTNPFMNGLFVTRFAIKIFDGPLLHALHPWVELTHAVLYSFMRTVVGPACALHLTYDLLFTKRGRENVPVWLSSVWVALCWTVLIGSWPWTQDSIDMARDGLVVKFDVDYDYGERYRHNGGEL